MTITTLQPSPAQPLFLNPAATTLAEVITGLAELEPDSRRRRELMSGIQTVARVLSTPVEAIPADPSYLGRLVRVALPARHDVSAARWSNALSLLRRALKLAGCRVMAGKRNHPLSPEWQVLMDALPSRYERAQLSRFVGELSRQEVQPRAVTVAMFDDFQTALTADSLLTNPRDRYQRTAVAWNKARDQVAGWPEVVAPALPGRETYVRPLSDFPASFQADAQLWLERLGDPGLSQDSPLKPVRPATLEKWAFALRQMASALVLQGVAIEKIASLADLLREGHDERIVAFFYERGKGASHQVHGIVARLAALARHHVALDTTTRETLLVRLRKMSGKVAPDTRGMTDKNRRALKPFEAEHWRRQLVNLPARIFDALPRGGWPSRHRQCGCRRHWRWRSCCRCRCGPGTWPGWLSAATWSCATARGGWRSPAPRSRTARRSRCRSRHAPADCWRSTESGCYRCWHRSPVAGSSRVRMAATRSRSPRRSRSSH